MLFLHKFEGSQTDDAFIPLGAYQGKFKINKDNKVISAVTEEKAHKKSKTPDNSPQKKEEKVNKQLQNSPNIMF